MVVLMPCPSVGGFGGEFHVTLNKQNSFEIMCSHCDAAVVFRGHVLYSTKV